MSKALRFKANGQYLQNSMFSTGLDYIGAYHADPDHFDEALAIEEEAMSIASWQQDFSIAFGIPADQIEAEVIKWAGSPETLPYADDADPTNKHVRLPVDPPPAPAPTLEEKVNALLAANPEAMQALGLEAKR